jgi:hypothetical protein
MDNKEICYRVQNDLEAFYDVYKKLLDEEGSFLNRITKHDNYYQLEYNYITIKFYDCTMDMDINCITGENYIKLKEKFNVVNGIPDDQLQENYYNNIYSLKLRAIPNEFFEGIIEFLTKFLTIIYC